jgi:hypothetical protein
MSWVLSILLAQRGGEARPSLIDRHSEAGTQRRASRCKKQKFITNTMPIGQAGPGGAPLWAMMSPEVSEVGRKTCVQRCWA